MCAARESLAPTLPTPGSLIRCCIPPRTADGVDARRDGHGHVHPRQTRDTARPRRQDDTHPSTHPPPPRDRHTPLHLTKLDSTHTLLSALSSLVTHSLARDLSRSPQVTVQQAQWSARYTIHRPRAPLPECCRRHARQHLRVRSHNVYTPTPAPVPTASSPAFFICVPYPHSVRL